MDRRDFIKKGSVGASGMAASGGSLLNSAQRGGSLLYGMEDYLARMDAGLARIDEWSVAAVFPGFEGNSSSSDLLGRKIMKSLYVTGMFRDLRPEDQVHPGMQDRMWAMQDTMDEALDGVDELLRRQTPESLERVQARLKEDPSIVQRIATFLDVEAARAGISDDRRAQTQAMIDGTALRLTSQPPSLVIEEYRAKVEKVSASDVESEAYQQWLLSKLGERTFWEQAAEKSPREKRISRGLKNMGIGAALFFGGVLLAAASGSDGVLAFAAVAGTVGAIWFLVGLIILLSGAAMSEEWDSGSA